MSNLGSKMRRFRAKQCSSETRFLRKVLREELGEDNKNRNLIIITAVHAVLLESGFIGFDPDSRTRLDRFHLPNDRSSIASSLSFYYTLPALLGEECVVMKFHSLENFVDVSGRLANNIRGSKTHRVTLYTRTLFRREINEFWKIVKDEMVTPLLTDICGQFGLPSPPCFMSLPTDLKMKILESLPGIDVARIGCVCKELKQLSGEEELWKMKVGEEVLCPSEKLLTTREWKMVFRDFCRRRKRVSGVLWLSGLSNLFRPTLM
ncbi:hypothetical protein UlMin_022476 [Ulmus minor]